jgi:hypothetical protein
MCLRTLVAVVPRALIDWMEIVSRSFSEQGEKCCDSVDVRPCTREANLDSFGLASVKRSGRMQWEKLFSIFSGLRSKKCDGA